jgi:hypothetical protein
MSQGFLIGETLLGQIKDTVKRVQGEPMSGHFTKIETRFEGGPPAAAGKTLEICTFAGAWPKGSTKTCTVSGSTSEIVVMNMFHHIGADCNTKKAAAARISGQWVLLVAECN